MANYFDTFNWDTWLNDAYNYGNPYNLQQAPPPPLDFEATLLAAINRFGYPIYAVNAPQTRYYHDIALARKYARELMERKQIFFVSKYPTPETKPKQVQFYAPDGIYKPQTKGTWLDDDGD
jgi:hypothetical protein